MPEGGKGDLGGGLPWQVNAFAGQKGSLMQWYKTGMIVAGVGVAAWWWFTSKDIEQKQGEAVERFGRHGEKVNYGDGQFKATVQKGDHFPGIPTTETNAPGGHTGGAKP